MILYDANAPGPNPATVRLFVHERGGLRFDVVTIDLVGLENRKRRYLTEVNARGEVPALRLDDGSVLTEITAICGYFDEIAEGGRKLFGTTPQERAVIHMWTRRAYLEVVLPFVNHWRGSEAAENAYRGHRILQPEAQRSNRLLAERGLNQFDDDLEGRTFIAGDDISMADILLYTFMATQIEGEGTPWLDVPQRPHVGAWYARMGERESSRMMLASLPARVRT
ncbi:glutathione S-transferase family protein [Streptomyces olivaceus]|uniref:glutathione S-transferase family protein n=1 Tax=Streptomyces olivaceus TaxID=47716 RepID=UPI001CCFFF40|nr:glutathione S-transferase family protein [Streptomyces olivaceus]MBZ6080494.1 glutathione S-transferase family protein [Streptomyces olivaceus]